MTFTVLRELGSGGFGTVWLARDEGRGRLVALKRPLTRVSDAELTRYRREFELLSELRHPHLVEPVDCGVDAEGPFLATEWIDGRSLASVFEAAQWQGRSIPLELVVALSRALGSVLEALRSRSVPVVHRDLSAENVLLAHDGRIKLIDFGAAREGEGDPRSAGILKGALSTLAPELYEGQPPSPASDVFSLGVLLFRALTGQAPFPTRTVAEAQRSAQFASVPEVERLAPATPTWLAEWVNGALRRDPSQRPLPTALLTGAESTTGSRAVSEFLTGLSSGPASEERRATETLGAPAPVAVARWWLWLVGGVAVLALIGITAWRVPMTEVFAPIPELPDGGMDDFDAGHYRFLE